MSASTLLVNRLAGGRNDSNFNILADRLNRGFTEDNTYRIRKPSAKWQFVVDDEPLDGTNEHWVWSPGFYAGMVRAELFRPDGSLAYTFRLDVSPTPAKLGLTAFQFMLDELWLFDPLLVLGTEPARTRIGDAGGVRNIWLEYARLRQHGETFLKAVTQIARQPIRELQAYRQQVPLHRVHRADRYTIVAAIRDPNTSKALLTRGRTVAISPFNMRFNVPITVEHLDGAANRCILALVRDVLWRATTLRQKLRKQSHKERSSFSRADLVSRWPRRNSFLKSFIARLGRLHRSELFVAVTRPEVSAAGLNAIAADPTYASAYGHGWKILRTGVEGPPDADELWLSPTWEIYERWAYARIVALIQKRWPTMIFNDGTPRGVTATAARCGELPDGTVIAVLLQPRFIAWDGSDMRPFRSISGRREPDIAIIVSGPSEWACLILDAKYRTSRTSILEAMASAHIYRDALRYKGERILAAILLTPRGGAAPWLEKEEFVRTNRVGVVEFSTEVTSGVDFVIDWLVSCTKAGLYTH